MQDASRGHIGSRSSLGNSSRVGVEVQQVCVLTYVPLIHDLKYILADHAAGLHAFRMHPGNEMGLGPLWATPAGFDACRMHPGDTLGLGPLWATPAGLVWKYNRCVS